jgi:hypothetical protein
MKKTVFMVMPFSDPVAASAYKNITKPVAETHGFSIQRADEIFSISPIFDDIVTAIEQSTLVIVDISGRNANCFYELGVAHTLKRQRTIMITHDEFDQVPFDVSHFRILKYEDSIDGKSKYELSLSRTLVSVTSGLAELYYPEFEVIVDVLLAADLESTIFCCMSLSKISSPLKVGANILVEGQVPGRRSTLSSGRAVEHLSPLRSRFLVEVVADTCVLTSKGEAFNGYIANRGFVVHKFNTDIFTEGYKSLWPSSHGLEPKPTVRV